jgi:hypothetical protein
MGNYCSPVINKSFKDAMNILRKTTFVLNNINANPPTEIWFFIHYLVRHDRIESQKSIRSLQPSECSPYQQDIMTIWAGNSHTCRGVGVLKIFTDPTYVTTLTKLFSAISNTNNKICFVDKTCIQVYHHWNGSNTSIPNTITQSSTALSSFQVSKTFISIPL